MKIAVAGKGGVGKTTIAAIMACIYQRMGKKVIAIDADPDANLAFTLGFPQAECIVPLIQMKEVIEERMEVKAGNWGGFFKLNPKVDDIPEKYCPEHNGIRLILMGSIDKGGSGCVCPESAFLRTIIEHLILERDEVVIMDMEAGIEHIGRGTARGVDMFIVVVEPGKRSIETANRIRKLAQDIGIEKLVVIGNKIISEKDKQFVKESLPDFEILGFVPYDSRLADIDRGFSNIFDNEILKSIENIISTT